MNVKKIIKRELNLEAKAIIQASDRIDDSMEKIVDLIYNCKGKIVVTGLGKTGIIGRKIASTLASTGTSSIFLHAAEGIHGDLGIVNNDDVIIAISYSGNSQELVSILPFFKFMKVKIIGFTGNLNSQLSNASDFIVDCSIPENAEPFGLVPTVSTTLCLALGDAIAVSLLEKRNFQIKDLAKFHPGGTIGKKLLLHVSDLMHVGNKIPIITKKCLMDKAIEEMISKNLGCTCVIDEMENLIGFIADGDLKRILLHGNKILTMSAEECMHINPKTIQPDILAVEALTFMEDNKITMLPVVDKFHKPIGLLHMHDLIKAGVVG